MSAVLCLPACLCVSTAASRGQAPHRNASKAFHRRGVTHPSRATRGHLNPEYHGLRSAESVKEVYRPELRHQRVPSADQHRPHSELHHQPPQPPMVNWEEAGKTWPQPHPHAVRLLRGLVWGQHYRHSNPQCEGGMPGSFELREDIGAAACRCITLLFVLYSVSFNFSKTHKIHKASFCLRPWLAQIFKLFYRSLVLLAALTPL